mmetsp:Transcript_5407/g.12761  ORF Transcript_5407/g.12761 Transcript_5407/m.12761 type:complete len:615 (-) Transcript_5407:58-1902(-)
MIDDNKGANSVTAPPIAPPPPNIQEMVQDCHILAGRLKSLISSVSIYRQANQELRDARAQFLNDCDEVCQDTTSKEIGKHANPNNRRNHAEIDVDKTSRSRGRIRQWFASIKDQQKETKEGDENVESIDEAKVVSSPAHESLEPREVLDYVIEWEEIVSTQIGERIGRLEKLKGEKDHYDRKVKKLRGRMSWLSVTKKPAGTSGGIDSEHAAGCAGQSKLGRNLSKQNSASQTYDAKEKEVVFLLQQVTLYGWKDLYPLVEATMREEWQRLQEEQDGSFGKCLPLAIAEIEAVLPDEVGADKDGTSGAMVSQTKGGPQEHFNRSKPLLVVDDTSPHATIAWMTTLEHEPDPYHPLLFELQSLGCDNGNVDTVNVQKMQEKYKLDGSTPFLIHKGMVLSGTLPLAEYMDQCWKDERQTRGLRGPASLIPPDPLEKYNMNKFLHQHSKLERIWNDALMFWLEWHRGKDSTVKTKTQAYAHERKELELKLQRCITAMEEVDLVQFPGPYLCGRRFTLADIHLFSYWEHIVVLLTMIKILDEQVRSDSKDGGNSIHYDWVFHGSKLHRLSTWYQNVSSRPSALAIQTANNKHGHQKSRRDHLIKHYSSLELGTVTLST